MSRFIGRICLVVTIVVAAGGCSSVGEEQAGVDGAATSDSTYLLPDAGVVGLEDPQPVDLYQGELLGQIRGERERLVAECMAASGYPQLLEVFALSRESIGRNPFSELRLRHGMFGPETEAQAREFGYLPVREWYALPQPLAVVSHDAAYDARYPQCVDAAWDALASGREGYLQYFEIGNDLGHLIQSSIFTTATRLVFDDWIGCMAESGYYGGTVDDYAESMYPPVFFGVPTGEWVGGGVSDRPTGTPGTVEILDPGSRGEYAPTEEEVTLALTDVACKREVELWGRLLPLLIGAQADAVDSFETSLLELNPQIEELARLTVEIEG